MEQFDYEQLVKATNIFSPSNLLGKGSHGSVYKAVLLQENKVVAVKRSTGGTNQVSCNDNSKKLDNEILVLSSLHENPCVVNFFGASFNESEKSKVLVMEYMPNGSLHDLLHGTTTPPPPWPKRVEIAIQVAKALQFLHEGKPLVIHRDVKSANVLFDSNWNAKLADYGLAVLQADSPRYQPSQPAGTIGYLDPCYTTPSKLSIKTDIFSYGVVLLEIICGRKVIDVSKTPASIVEWAVPLITKQRSALIHEICDSRIAFPAFMEGTLRKMLKMAARCVSSKEENRPSISEIVGEMGSYCLIERVKLVPSWSSIMKTMVLVRRRRKLAKQCQVKCTTQKCDVHGDIRKGKILFKDILLGEIRLK